MLLPKSRALRIGLAVLLALVAVPVLAMAYFQPLDPPTGVMSAAELRAHLPPSEESVIDPKRTPEKLGVPLGGGNTKRPGYARHHSFGGASNAPPHPLAPVNARGMKLEH